MRRISIFLSILLFCHFLAYAQLGSDWQKVKCVSGDENIAVFTSEGEASKKSEVAKDAKRRLFYALFYKGVIDFNDTQPLMPVKHPDGNWSGQGNYTNFAAVLEEGGTRATTKNDFWNTLALELKPLAGLSIKMDYTFNYYAEHIKNHAKSFNEYGVDGKFLQVFQYTNPNYAYEHQQNDTYNTFNLVGNFRCAA